MINVVCGIRSTGRICTDLAVALENQGHEVKIAYGREHVPDRYKKYAVRIGTDFDIKLHGIKARLFDDCGFGSRSATYRFIEWIRQYDPDIIHLHNIHGYYINIEILFEYLRKCGKKIIWTLHDCWAFTGHSAYCDAINCERWIAGCYSCPNIKEYPKSIMDFSKKNWRKKKALLSGIPCLTIVTPSMWLAGLVKKSFLAEYPINVIHNGIDVSKFYPLENDFRNFYGIDNKIMLLGKPVSWENDNVLKDYVELAKRLPNNVIIVLIGLKEEQKKDLPHNIISLRKTDSYKELEYINDSADMIIDLSCRDKDTLTHDVNLLLEHNYKKIGSRYRDVNDNGYWQNKKKLGLIGKKIIICIAAIWDKRKGLKDVLSLYGVTNYKFIVVGLSSEQKNIMPYDIIGISRTDDIDELRKLYAISDVFVNPTYEDNFPTVNIESLCSGTPVISYQTGGSPESIGECGLVVEKGNISSLREAIYTTKISVSKCKEQGNVFDKEFMIAKYLKTYV